MSPRQGLTALITAGNEERHLKECIESARFADEVLVVVDANSVDRTEEIARAHADRVLVRPYVGAAEQKNWAIPQAAHPWILVVDCDERVTPRLRDDILAVLENDGPHDAYNCFRENVFIGRTIVGCGWQRDILTRLFRRDRARYIPRHVHAGIEFPDGGKFSIGTLKGKLFHHAVEDLDPYLNKFLRYTQWAGEDRATKTPKVGWRHLALRPAWRFFRQFILYSGWRDGKAGFIICMLAAFSVFLKYARVWEKRQKENRARDEQ
jgi:glycosyltransferase involved in cell wall biosynthesis